MQFLFDPKLWTLIVAGFMGSTVYALNKGADLPWYGKLTLIFTGTVTSFYCADLVALWLSSIVSGMLTTAAKVPVAVTVPSGLSGFLCGYLAQSLLGFVLGWATKKKDEALKPPTT